MRTINIMSGIPGCGKTTYITTSADYRDIQLHRDDFRAELRAEHNNESYFPVSATEEWRLWANKINTTLAEYPENNIWIDQTTIGVGALSKLYHALNLTSNDRIIVHVFNLPLNICKGRNNLREGFARVPDDVMLSMFNNFRRNMITKSSAKRVSLGIEVVFHNEY